MAAPTTQRPTDARVDRYRDAETALWAHHGLTATERFIDIETPHTRIRVTEIGSGRPVVFVGGTGGTGPYWAALLRELPDIRCLVIDRPGFGLSSAIDYAGAPLGDAAGQILTAVLDAYAIDRAPVVGASIGNAWALHTALRHPDRVAAIALLGGGPLSPEVAVPGFVRMLRTPLGALFVRIPESEKMLTGMLRGIGHGPTLDAGGIPRAYFDWHRSLVRSTKTMHAEREMVRAIVDRSGFRPGLILTEGELASIHQPIMMVYGTGDDVGSEAIWRRFIERFPRGELHVVNGGGHIPWLDDPATVGAWLSGLRTKE